MLTLQEQSILQELARAYAACAAQPKHAEKRELWLALNRCKMRRPMVLIDQIPWNEMDVDGSLACHVEDPYWRGVETWLRRTLYQQKYMPVDQVLTPYIQLPRPIHSTGWGLEVERTILQMDATSDVVSQSYHNQIRDFSDLEKLHTPVITLDREKENQILAEAEAVFTGICPYRLVGQTMHLGLWDQIAQWMGVENCYIELMDRPELIHALMEKLTCCTLEEIAQRNALGVFDVDSHLCHCSHTFSDDLPLADCDPQRPTSSSAWAFGLAQLFTSVSPAITAEFEVAYMRRIFPHFGAIYYGCCDRLDDRLDVIEKLPRVRKISCSPWSDRDRFAANLPHKYVMSNKPNPVFVASGTLDEDAVREDLRHTIGAARTHGVDLEIILKDISTVSYKPDCLWRWAQIAQEEVER